jgi:anhydro-N-acetylmuramic acid kinase
MDSKNNFKVIGLMSGTSLDGLDIALCHFKKNGKGWQYAIEKASTIKYSTKWINALSTAQNLPGDGLMALDAAYGQYLGKEVKDFKRKYRLEADFIASHGHTIFHQPSQGFTFQLGNGNAVYAACGVPVVFDFRSLDVMLGGEGAPLVPAGDKLLFREYDVCLNLGGIANISMDIKGDRMAYDVCFNNMGLNYLMNQIGKEFDDDGATAASGVVNKKMLRKLAAVYKSFRNKRPSLGREIFERRIKPIIDDPEISLADKLCTLTTSAADEIAAAVTSVKKNPQVLCTGGGAFNSFFISTLLDACADKATLIIPDEEIIKFKEAMVFAFLGVLRVKGEVNCFRSVTGATMDSSSGTTVGF